MPKIADTLTMSHLLDENLFENGLKYLTRTVLKREVTEYKDAIKFGVDSDEFYIYAMADAINTYDLYKIYSPEIARQGLGHLYWDIEAPFQKALMHLAINGIAADTKAAKNMKEEVQHLYYKIENELLNIFGGEYIVSITPRSRVVSCVPSINFNSSEQIVPLIEGLGFKIFEKSKKKKKKSWAKAAKERLKGQHPTIDLIIKLGKVEKLTNGFLKPFKTFVERDGRIRSSFMNTVCVTGRLSARNPNIEQLPKNNSIANIRNLYIAEPGNVLIVADYSGQEVRIMAEESHDKTFKNALIKGLDLHQETADAVGVTRDKAKCIVFGTAYGKSSYGFSKDFQCSEVEAQAFIDKFLNKYPGLKRAIDKTRRQVYQYGFVRNMSGRKRRFPNFHKGSKWAKERCYRQAFNFKIQSFGADMVKAAAALIINNKNIKLVNIIHDEICMESPKDYVEVAIPFIKYCMMSAMPISIPLEVKISFAERYGNAK